jgi:hypothetical protein
MNPQRAKMTKTEQILGKKLGSPSLAPHRPLGFGNPWVGTPPRRKKPAPGGPNHIDRIAEQIHRLAEWKPEALER